jgi:uncharacterized membrane protein YbhN (UPF0104 family)
MKIETKTVIAVILLVILFVISIPFEKEYANMISSLAQNPAARLFAGLVVTYLSYHDILLGALAFVTVFLWMTDIQLLSTSNLLVAK